MATYKIHPSIGIARVGSSDHYYVASETWNPDFVPDPGDSGYRDSSGKVKRMACRFRIYKYDNNGTVVGEIDYTTIKVRWEVHVVNKKAAKRHPTDDMSPLNPLLTESEATIDPGPQSVGFFSRRVSLSGDIGAVAVAAGVQSVDLGGLKYEDDGTLLVIGGQGDSGFFTLAQPDAEVHHNSGWFDGTSDGWVTAWLKFPNGDVAEVDASAWVIVGPPDYAHGIVNLVTLWDIVRDRSAPPSTANPSFTKEIYPIIHRVCNLQWTLYDIAAKEYGRMAMHGHGYKMDSAGGVLSDSHRMHSADFEADGLGGDFLTDTLWAQMQDPTTVPASGNKTIGEHVMERLKHPDTKGNHGPDIMGTASSMPPLEQLTVTPTQYAMLQEWSIGNCNFDWDPTWNRADPVQNIPTFFPDLASLAVADQPAALDKGALMSACGGAFAPGIEAGRKMANGQKQVDEDETGKTVNTYSGPWRIDRSVISPGDLTQSLSVPWQSGMNLGTGNWWPASRPVLVLIQSPAGGSASGGFAPYSWTRPNTAVVDIVDADVDDYNIRDNYDSVYQNQKMSLNAEMIRDWNILGFVIPYREGHVLKYVESYRG